LLYTSAVLKVGLAAYCFCTQNWWPAAGSSCLPTTGTSTRSSTVVVVL